MNGQMNRQVSEEEVQMASKYMKKVPTSLVIKEMQFKTTFDPFHPRQNGSHQHKKQQVLARKGKRRNLHILLVEM
jgi:hypothetical protein